jgi:hypothetical protein
MSTVIGLIWQGGRERSESIVKLRIGAKFCRRRRTLLSEPIAGFWQTERFGVFQLPTVIVNTSSFIMRMTGLRVNTKASGGKDRAIREPIRLFLLTLSVTLCCFPQIFFLSH